MWKKNSETLLQDNFFLFPTKTHTCQVKLSRQALSYECTDEKNGKVDSHEVKFSDIIGCMCKKEADDRVPSVYFTVFSYPFRNKNNNLREKKEITFGINRCVRYDENLKIAINWRNVIMRLARGLPVTDAESCDLPELVKLLVLVNPHSGSGKAMEVFENDVKVMLKEADVQYKVIKTEYAGHATELMKTLRLSEWYGVLIVSGDGLLFEVVNGLMNRNDWIEAMETNLGIVPGGSGNALCCSINYAAGESFRKDFVLHSTFVLVKHKVLPMDLVVVETKGSRLYSFLSVTWGIISDIDYESEKYRNLLGGARFTVGAIKRIASLRHYKGRVSFLPVTKYIPKCQRLKGRAFSVGQLRSFTLTHSEGRRYANSQIGSLSMPESMCNGNSSEPGRVNSENNDVFHECGVNSNDSILSINDAESGCYPAFSDDDDDEIVREIMTAVKQPDSPVPSPLLPALNEPLPDSWVVLEGEFVTVCAVYQTHLGDDLLASPQSRINDGVIHLMVVRKGISKNNLLKLFLEFENGSHVDSPYVELVPVLAFRIEPESSKGNIMVDGEQVPVAPIQGQVLPGLAKIMAIK
ncbi:hypothetical protein ScPMuIL_003598 [Solemya velum]